MRAVQATRPAALCLLFLAASVVLPSFAAHTQELGVIDDVVELDFDDPEAWTLKFFSSASLLTPIGGVQTRETGQLDLAFEALSVPHLDTEQRTVGFDGLKTEDLNRSPVWGRLRVGVGVGGGVGVELGWLPPIEVDGAEANIVSLAIERRFSLGPRWGVGLRAFGQRGEVEGDLTCGRQEAGIPPGSPGNEFGCQEVSQDSLDIDQLGIGVTLDWHSGRRVGTHFGASVQEHDMEFQVDALTFGLRDRTLLRADGSTVSLTAGASYELRERWTLAGELFYSPLDRRDRQTLPVESDDLLNFRALLRWRVR